MSSGFIIRQATEADTAFLYKLSSRLSGVPGPAWHDRPSMQAFQDRFMAATLGQPVTGSQTLVAETPDNLPLGYIHMRPGIDGVTEEPCGYVALLALEEAAEGRGVAGQLMQHAEDWARSSGYRLLSLDAFANNKRALDFYVSGGFQPESIRLVKPL